MRSLLRTIALGAALLLVLAAPASAITVAQLGKRLTSGFVYVGPAVKNLVDVRKLQAEARKDKARFIVLKVLPSGVASPDRLARRVLARLPKARVAFVTVAITDGKTTELGVAHRTQQRSTLDATVAQYEPQAQTDPTTGLVALADAIATGKVPPPADSSASSGDGAASDSGGGRWWLWLLGAIAAGALILALLRWRAQQQVAVKRRGGSTSTARNFHVDRLEELARRHAELTHAVADRESGSPIVEHHETAGSKLVALRRQLSAVYSPRELRLAATELDSVEWHLLATESLLAGRPLPPQPSATRNGLCFFTHEHGLGTVDIEVTRPDGTVTTIWVCAGNALALERGEPPEVSMVNVGNRSIPWPAAPTWYGAPGWTLEDLPGLEYRGREIWGRETPRRETPLPTVADDQTFGTRESDDAAVLPPGVDAPDDAPAGFAELDEGPISSLVDEPEVAPSTSDPTVHYDPFADEDEANAWEPRASDDWSPSDDDPTGESEADPDTSGADPDESPQRSDP